MLLAQLFAALQSISCLRPKTLVLLIEGSQTILYTVSPPAGMLGDVDEMTSIQCSICLLVILSHSLSVASELSFVTYELTREVL